MVQLYLLYQYIYSLFKRLYERCFVKVIVNESAVSKVCDFKYSLFEYGNLMFCFI